MTIDDIRYNARIYNVDYLVIEELPQSSSHSIPVFILKAPYMPRVFIKSIKSLRPVNTFIRYQHSKGFIHWLAWKLRTV